MSKQAPQTAKGKMLQYLAGRGRGRPFTVKEFAARFKTGERNITMVMAELRAKQWKFERTGGYTPGVNKPTYIPKPPSTEVN